MGFLLRLFTGNPLSMVWVIGGVALVAFGLGGSAAWTVQGWRMKGNEAEWQTREAKINADTAIRIKANADKILATERQRATDINLVASDYEDQLKEKNDALVTALNTVKRGGLFSHGPACPPVAGDGMPGAAASSGVGDGEARARLPDADAEFLLTEASRADKVVAQLTACQAVLQADRAKPH